MPKKEITLTRETIERYLADYGDDGHSLLDPEAVLFYGFPEEFLSGLEETFTSDQVWLEDGFTKVRAIPSLALLKAIAGYLGAKPERSAIGRGTQARIYTEAIRKVL